MISLFSLSIKSFYIFLLEFQVWRKDNWDREYLVISSYIKSQLSFDQKKRNQ